MAWVFPFIMFYSSKHFEPKHDCSAQLMFSSIRILTCQFISPDCSSHCYSNFFLHFVTFSVSVCHGSVGYAQVYSPIQYSIRFQIFFTLLFLTYVYFCSEWTNFQIIGSFYNFNVLSWILSPFIPLELSTLLRF